MPPALLLKAAVSAFALPVEEHGPGQRVATLSLVQPRIDTAAKLHVNASIVTNVAMDLWNDP